MFFVGLMSTILALRVQVVKAFDHAYFDTILITPTHKLINVRSILDPPVFNLFRLLFGNL